MSKPPLTLLTGIALALLSPVGVASAQVTHAAAPAAEPALAQAIIQLYDADQALLADLSKAKQDPGFKQTFLAYRKRDAAEPRLRNFGDPALYARWSRDPAAPPIVRRAVEFRTATDARLRDIVACHGWPRRQMVGDQAAAGFWFLFGHADDDNAWRLTQLPALKRVFREDHVTPRLYAHMRDRLANVAGEPQIYGSIMGPDEAPGSAKLYAPLVDDAAAADARRAAIGLPGIEADLATFRNGADIGPYMMPMIKGMSWTLADVYTSVPAPPVASKP